MKPEHETRADRIAAIISPYFIGARRRDIAEQIAAAIEAERGEAAAPEPSDDGADPFVEAGPAGTWRDGVMQRIETAHAAIRKALT